MLDERTLYFLFPSVSEVVEAFQALTYPDVTVALSVGLWLIVLALPLTGVDRRDSLAGFAYMTFMAFAGVAIVFAAPRRMLDFKDAAVHVVVVLLLVIVAGARWSLRKKKKVVAL